MKISLGKFEMEIIHHNPRIYTVDNFITPTECRYFQEISKDYMQRSTVSAINHDTDGKSDRFEKVGSIDKRRTSKNCWVRHDHSDITQSIVKRISELVQMPKENAESFQVLHYGPNEEYQPHLDTFEEGTEIGDAYLEDSGQRLITVIGYLNEVTKGGETNFPNIGKKVCPALGRIAVFQDCFEGTNEPNKNALHGASPVISGEKWAFNLWYRQFQTNLNH